MTWIPLFLVTAAAAMPPSQSQTVSGREFLDVSAEEVVNTREAVIACNEAREHDRAACFGEIDRGVVALVFARFRLCSEHTRIEGFSRARECYKDGEASYYYLLGLRRAGIEDFFGSDTVGEYLRETTERLEYQSWWLEEGELGRPQFQSIWNEH